MQCSGIKTLHNLFIIYSLQTCDTGHSKLPSLKNSTSQSNAGLSFVFHLPHCSSDHALLLVVDAINHMFSLTEEPVKGVRYWVKNLWPVYLAILSCWEGPIPYLELFWVGPFEKTPCRTKLNETEKNWAVGFSRRDNQNFPELAKTRSGSTKKPKYIMGVNLPAIHKRSWCFTIPGQVGCKNLLSGLS